MKSDGFEKTILLGIGGRTGGRGRPRNRWLDEGVKINGLKIWEAHEATRDRCGWGRFVMEVTRDPNDLTAHGNTVIINLYKIDLCTKPITTSSADAKYPLSTGV